MGILSRLLGRAAPTPPPAPVSDTRVEAVPDAGHHESWYVKASEMPKDRYLAAAGAMPPLHLVPYDGFLQLCEDETGLLVGPGNRAATHAGIYVVNLRGVGHHQPACRAGDFSPGAPVRLVREPENEYDPNAVGVQAQDREGVAGYVNKGRAKFLARRIDAGEQYAAASTNGTPAGQAAERIAVVVARPDVLAHLLSPRPGGLPVPAHLH